MKLPRWPAGLSGWRTEESAEVTAAMIRVDNRKVVAGIAADTYKAHWKRNIITVSAILMTTFFNDSGIRFGIQLLEYGYAAHTADERHGL